MKDKYKNYMVMALILGLTFSSLLYMIKSKNDEYELITSPIEKEDEEVEDAAIEDTPEINIIKKVPIYVCGEVQNPDVYYLSETAIVKDGIMAAGGFTADANEQAWNLAMEVEKGLKIDVPKAGEQIDKSSVSYDNREEGIMPSNITSGLININRANVQELSTLPGIGPVIAQNIIDYRETGEFKSIEEITNVSRIGQGTLEKIKDLICVQ